MMLFSVFSLLFRPYDADERYMGYFNNSNSAGEFFACSYAVLFVMTWKLAIRKKKEKADVLKGFRRRNQNARSEKLLIKNIRFFKNA